MTTQHTQGRLHIVESDEHWGRINGNITSDNGEMLGSIWCGTSSQNREDARRLVACWNACNGLSTEHMENIDMLGETLAGRFEAFRESERELIVQRDELLAALKLLWHWTKVEHEHFEQSMPDDFICDAVEAAIAKAEGGAA